MSEAGDMRTVETRTVLIEGVRWDLTLVRDDDEWVLSASTIFGEGPEPLRTTDESEARDAFENFERHIGAARPDDGE